MARRSTARWDRNAWLLLLIAEVDAIRARHELLRIPRRPNLSISDELTTTLGHWCAERRLITISSSLLAPDRWGTLAEVLRHEIAHQLVSEVFGDPDPEPHGAAFRRACEIVGITPRARMTPDALVRDDTGDDGVRRKIAKLLALGESPESHEAEAALRKAHEIALRHNIRLLDAKQSLDYELRIVGPPLPRVPAYYWTILNILEEFYFVLYISRAYRSTNPGLDGKRKRFTTFEVYGTRDNVETASYVFDFLVAQGLPLWRRYKFKNGLTSERRKLSFLRGIYSGFRDKLVERQSELEAQTHALVWTGDPELGEFFRGRNPRVHRVSTGGSRHYADAHAAGREEGRRLKINAGLGRASGGHGGTQGLLGSR